ncbi:uncharacterized protein [Neodiprion pinetum]|uniref:uncharacterized protein n=1 Tax=Neodiprion pinetum TaxID=441929 RepID=UPI001EE0DB80|nr:uncharacterized protein LOC124220256 [Neodiprion pinetum]
MPNNDNTQVPMETSTQQNTSTTNPNTSLRVDGSSYIHKFDYKDVFKIIPEFDNTSAGCSIQTFIDEFESVKQFIPQCGEEFLVKMLRSKCRGEPLKRVTNAKIRTIDELAKFLRTHFKPDKDIDTWIKELNDFEQRQDEQIIDFNYRIGTHLQMTLAEIDLAETTDAQPLKSWAIKVAVKSFIAGLLPRYSLFLSKSKYNTLQEVVTEAMELEKRQKNIKNAENISPSIIIESKDLKHKNGKFLVDTGSQLNLIRISELKNPESIDASITYELNGVSKVDKPMTLGKIKIRINNILGEFNVVSQDFPLNYTGIIGSEFMHDNDGKIDYRTKSVTLNKINIPFSETESVLLLARQKTAMFIRVKNTEILEGYVPRLDTQEGIYIGETVVSNNNGIAYLYAINTLDEDVEMEIPVIPLYPFDTSVDEDSNSIKCETLEHAITRTRGNRANEVFNLLRLDHLNSEERKAVALLIDEYADLFHIPGEPLRVTNTCMHRILTTDEIPINTRQYRHPPFQKPEIEKQITDLLKMNIIEPSNSPYNSPLWIVPKKEDSKGNKRWRLVIDYRKLNEKTIGDAYPLPLISDILDQLGGAKYFSIFDLASGFHQIAMHPDDKHKTAFTTPHGHYEFNRMPFGLKNAPATFQRLMDLVLRGLQGIDLFVYLDDIVIYARSLEEHATKFIKLAERLRKANLTLQSDKCEFLRTEVKYLGHIISADGVKPDPKKIEAVKKFPVPKTTKNVKEFLGLAGYYRRFIKNFAKIAKPLSELTSKNKKFEWNSNTQLAFEILRDKLCEAPILQYPDFSSQFVVTTDASGFAVGAILSQGKPGEDAPVAYASRVLNKHERNYSTTEKEMVAIVYAIKTFRPYLYGRQFTLLTDHRPLVWVNSTNDPTSRVMRWRERLKEFQYKIQYKAGKINTNADALSRNPVDIEKRDVYPIKFKWRRSADPALNVAPGIARLRSSSDSAQRLIQRDAKIRRRYVSSSSVEEETIQADYKIQEAAMSTDEEDFLGFPSSGGNKHVGTVDSKNVTNPRGARLDSNSDYSKNRTMDNNRPAQPIASRLRSKFVDKNTNSQETGKHRKLKILNKRKSSAKRFTPFRHRSEYEDSSSDELSDSPENHRTLASNKSNENQQSVIIEIESDSQSSSSMDKRSKKNQSTLLPDYVDSESSSLDSDDSYKLNPVKHRINKSNMESSIPSIRQNTAIVVTESGHSLASPPTPTQEHTSATIIHTPKIVSVPNINNTPTGSGTPSSNRKNNFQRSLARDLLNKRSPKTAEFTPSPLLRTRRKTITDNLKVTTDADEITPYPISKTNDVISKQKKFHDKIELDKECTGRRIITLDVASASGSEKSNTITVQADVHPLQEPMCINKSFETTQKMDVDETLQDLGHETINTSSSGSDARDKQRTEQLPVRHEQITETETVKPRTLASKQNIENTGKNNTNSGINHMPEPRRTTRQHRPTYKYACYKGLEGHQSTHANKPSKPKAARNKTSTGKIRKQATEILQTPKNLASLENVNKESSKTYITPDPQSQRNPISINISNALPDLDAIVELNDPQNLEDKSIEISNLDNVSDITVSDDSQASVELPRQESTNLIETRDNLEMRKDNYLCFISTNGIALGEIGKFLDEKGYLKNIKPVTEYQIGHIIILGTPKKRIIALVTQEHKQDTPLENNYYDAFVHLKQNMEDLNIKTASISQGKSGINDLGWIKI